MANPIIYDGEQHREMTKTEHEQWLELVSEVEAQTVAANAIAAAKASAKTKLAALGLTETEIAALLGA